VYTTEQADKLAEQRGWVFRADGDKQRRVVPSPVPRRIVEIQPVQWLLEHGCVVICAGGGGVPTMFSPGTTSLMGVEAVIDKDRASAVLATDLDADLPVIATDVDGVYLDWGTPEQRGAPRRRTRISMKAEGMETR
jgi:carbamate kinase